MLRTFLTAISPVLGFLAISLPLISSPVSAQILVGPSSTGAPFQEIQPAIDAANPGQTIFVSAGTYEGFQLTKPMHIIGAGATQVIVEKTAVDHCPLGWTTIEVTGLPANTNTVIAGMTLRGPVPGAVFATCYCARMHHNLGTIVLHDIRVASPLPPLDIHVSDFVFISNSLLAAVYPAGTTVSGLWQQGSGLRVIESNVWVADSEIFGLGATALHEPVIGFAGARVINGNLFLARTSVTGGDGGYAPFGNCGGQSGYPGGPGVLVAGASFLRVVGDGNDSITAGSGGLIGACDGAGASAILVTGPGLVYRSDAVVMEPSLTGGVAEPETTLLSNGVDLLSTQTLPSLSLSVSGNQLTLKFSGEPSYNVTLFAALATSSPLALPGVDGAGALDPNTVLFQLNTFLSAGGSRDLTLSLPTSSALSGISIYFQWLQQEPGGTRKALSNPATIVLGS